jgi:hypothetical protein
VRPLTIWLYWRYLTLSQKVAKTPFGIKFVHKLFHQNQPKTRCWHFFDLKNEFRANRMKFGVFGEKIFLTILTPLVLKIINFGQNSKYAPISCGKHINIGISKFDS